MQKEYQEVEKMHETDYFTLLLIRQEDIPQKFFYIYLIGCISNSILAIQKLEQNQKINSKELMDLRALIDIFKNKERIENKIDFFKDTTNYSKNFKTYSDILEKLIVNEGMDIESTQFKSIKDSLLAITDFLSEIIYSKEKGLNAISVS